MKDGGVRTQAFWGGGGVARDVEEAELTGSGQGCESGGRSPW